MNAPFQGSRGPFGTDLPGSPSNPYPANTDFSTINGNYYRERIWVVNLCVGHHPDPANPTVFNGTNISQLEWMGSTLRWQPPPGEVILEYKGLPSLVDATPGVLALYGAWASPDVIPDIMIPDGGVFRYMANMYIKNATTVAGCGLMMSMSGANPTETEPAEYPFNLRSFSQTSAGNGPTPTVSGYAERGGTSFYKGGWGLGDTPNSGVQGNRGRVSRTAAHQFVAGNMKGYVKAVTKHASDNVVLHWVKITAGI